MYIRNHNKSKPLTMKNLVAIAILMLAFINSTTVQASVLSDKEKTTTEPKNEVEKKVVENKNLHSIKKWRITIELKSGKVISKIITVQENSELSALETAFMTAEKHVRRIKNIKNFQVSPIASNSYVLLAGD